MEHGRALGRRSGLGSELAATSGIALYGGVNELSRLFLPLFAIGALALSGGLAGRSEADTAWTIAIVSAIAFVVATGLIVAVVRSERVADWLGRTGQRRVTWVMRRLGREHCSPTSMAPSTGSATS